MWLTLRENSPSSKHLKNKALQSSGRTHVSGMMGVLHCGLMAQWHSELAPPSASKVLLIADAAPRAAGEVMTLLPRDMGPVACA
jgi:hypothetical protein